MNRKFSSYNQSQTTRSRLRSVSPSQLYPIEFMIKSNSSQTKSQQQTPIKQQQKPKLTQTDQYGIVETEQEIRKLRIKSVRTQSQFDSKFISYQVQDQIKKKEAPNFKQEIERVRNLSIYKKLREMKLKEETEKKQLLEKEILEKKLLQQKLQLKIDAENIMEKKRIITYKFKISTVVNALTLQQIHAKPHAARFAKLVAKHYLTILDYNNYLEAKKDKDNHQSQNNTPKTINLDNQQIIEIQDLINGGIIRVQCEKKQQKHRVEVKASEIFSDNVLKRVRLLQSCFHLKVFSKKNKTHKYRRQQTTTVISSSRVKAQTRRLGDIKFMNQYSPKQNISFCQNVNPQEFQCPKKSLRLFRSLTKGSISKQKSQFFKRQNTNELFLKGVQMLHYPIIKYISIFYKNMVVWSISYKDITADKSCLILFFKGEGKFKYRYRLDIPIGQNQTVNYSENCLTVWPTVRDYLISYLQMKGQLALIDQKQLPTAQIYKLNFIKGLTDRSRMKITSLDIYGITETIKILNYLQKSQIVKIRKIFGTVFELLPQFIDLNKYGAKQQLIVNLPLIHNLILELRTFESKLLLQKRNMGDFDEYLLENYSQFLYKNIDYINQIIMFRFLHNNPLFFRDQLLKDASNLEQKQIYVQSATLKLNDILQVESNLNHLSFGSYCLLSLFIQITCKADIKLLLLDVNNKHFFQNLTDFANVFDFICKKPNQLNYNFNQKHFKFLIKVSFHERDEAGYKQQQFQKNLFSEKSDRVFKQLELTVVEWLKLCQAIKKSQLENDEEQSFDFNKLIKTILLEQQFYSKIAEYTLKTIFCLSLKLGQIVLKQTYRHILSVQFNFLEQLDHYNFQKCMGYVHKFSVYPTELLDIRVLKPEQKRQSIIEKNIQQFQKSFKQINTTDIKLNKSNTKITLIIDYQYEYRVSQSIQTDLWQFQMTSYFFSEKNYNKFYIVNNQNGLKLILMKLFKPNIIIKIDDEELIYKILCCEQLSRCKINQQMDGLIHKIFAKNSFLKYNLNFFTQKKKHPLPSQKQIKFMLINDSVKLLNLFDRLIYIFLFKYPLTGSKIFVHTKVYFICKDIHQKNNEKLFYFQNEHLFLGLEIFELKSKLKKYIVIMNRYDIEKLFQLKEYLTTQIIHNWCQTIINNLSFDKQNIYRLPYLQNLNQYILPKLDDDDKKKQKFKRSMTNDYKFDEKANDGKQFLRPQIKLFRVVGHYVIKYFMTTSQNQIKLFTRQSEIKNDDQSKSVSIEFTIITIQAHNIFDMFRITYYFPKSKRRLMTYLSILQFQEMDFRDNLIFDLLEFQQFKTYKDIETYLKTSKNGPHFKHSMQLDKQVLTKIKFMKQSVDVQHPFQIAFKKSQNNFLKVSDDLITKNRFLLSQIKQNQQLSEKVIKFLQFTRQLNNDQQFEQQHKFLEIKIWELLLQQVFELKYSNSNFINNYIHLIDRIIQTFDSTRKNQIKIIGKEYLLKQMSSNSLKNNYTVQSNVTQLYTRLILTHNIKVTEKLNFPQTDIILNIGVLEYPLLEFICSQEIKLERLGNAYLECFLENNKVKQQNQSIFFPQQLISYSQSSDYTIYLRYYCIQNLKYKDIRLNMRELLNLFIADGFFKSKTNYMNSRLSQADIQNMCIYLSQKIRDQNYLNLSSLVLLKKEKKFSLSSQIILETQDSLVTNQIQQVIQGEGYIYTHIYKNLKQIIIIQLQLFLQSKRVIVSNTNNKTLQFEQKIYTFVEANELTPNFLIFIKLKQFKYALNRLALVITSAQFLENEKIQKGN